MKLVRKNYETQQEKRMDFVTGIGIWFVLNVLLGAVIVAIPFWAGGRDFVGQLSPLISVLSFLPFLVNIGLAVYFAFTRYWIALGMLAAYAAAILLGIILGVVLSIVCFFGLMGSGGL